jgi:VanZ family protein
MRAMIFSRERLHRARLAVFALFWPALAVVIVGSLIPLDEMPLDLGVDYEDLILHFAGYAILAGMAAMALRSRSRALGAAFGLIVLGGLIEILQGYTGRDPSLYDAIANGCGVGFGCFTGRAIVEPLHRRYGSGPG